MFLCKSISKPNKKALKHPINGTYKMNDDGIFKLSVVGFTRGSLVKGAFLMDGNNWERGTMEGIVASTNNESIKNQISKTQDPPTPKHPKCQLPRFARAAYRCICGFKSTQTYF